MPLSGIQVLDFSHAIAGPVACRMLADAGADVIKIEPPGGDFTRISATRDGDSMLFLCSNRGKRSLCVDLKNPKGWKIVWDLAVRADVMLDNFRVGVMDELKLGYKFVSEENARLVYCRISPYGETGPLARRRGGDTWAQAMTGVVSAAGWPDEPPHLAPHLIIDYTAGLLSAYSILLALMRRQITGKGSQVNNNLIMGGLFFQDSPFHDYLIDGKLRQKWGRGIGQFPLAAYPAADGDVVIMHGSGDDEWTRLCAALGLQRLLSESKYDNLEKRQEHSRELYAIFDAAFRQKTRAEWSVIFNEHGLRCDPCFNHRELVQHPQFKAIDPVVEIQHPTEGKIPMLGWPVRFADLDWKGSLRPTPLRGEHSREILSEVGYSQEDIDALDAEGAIYCATEADKKVPNPRAKDFRYQQRKL